VAKAATFYRKALAVDPNDAKTARLLGHALMLLGDLAGAETALFESLGVASAHRDS
jgi:Flp pilus assembly protein TadD